MNLFITEAITLVWCFIWVIVWTDTERMCLTMILGCNSYKKQAFTHESQEKARIKNRIAPQLTVLICLIDTILHDKCRQNFVRKRKYPPCFWYSVQYRFINKRNKKNMDPWYKIRQIYSHIWPHTWSNTNSERYVLDLAG